MKKAVIISLSLFLGTASAAAQSPNDTVRAISVIKMDPQYVYGDATMPTLEEARAQAFALLLDEVLKMQGVCPDSSAVSYLQHRRGRMERVLAYIPIADISPASLEEVDPAALLEEALLVVRVRPDLDTVMKSLGRPEYSYGVLGADTSGQTLEESYILVFEEQFIDAVYSPVDDSHTRRLLRTGERTNRIAYKKGDTIIWVHIDSH